MSEQVPGQATGQEQGHEQHEECPEVDPNDFSELEGRPEEADLPPPAPKISASDPSLPVASSGRTVRKRAVATAISVAVAVAAGSLLFSGNGQATAKATRAEPSVVTPPVPQALLDAPERIERKPEVPAAAVQAPAPAVPTRSTHAAEPAQKAKNARRSKAEDELEKARHAGILVDTGLPDPPLPRGPRDEDDDDGVESHEPRRRSAAAAASGGGDIFADDPNMQERKNRFLSGERAPSGNQRNSRIRHPRSPYLLRPGTIITAAVVSAISSDLPGPVIARVTENVCDSITGEWLLVPQGSLLVAYYDSMVAWGQERVLMCWKQLELLNGDEMPLGCMPAADWAGQAGMRDEVDEHWWRIVKGVAVSSLLTASTAAAAGNTVGYSPTLPQLAARGAATDIASTGGMLTRRNIMVQPTLSIRQAQPVNVIITEPLDFSSDSPATPCHSRQEY